MVGAATRCASESGAATCQKRPTGGSEAFLGRADGTTTGCLKRGAEAGTTTCIKGRTAEQRTVPRVAP